MTPFQLTKKFTSSIFISFQFSFVLRDDNRVYKASIIQFYTAWNTKISSRREEIWMHLFEISSGFSSVLTLDTVWTLYFHGTNELELAWATLHLHNPSRWAIKSFPRLTPNFFSTIFFFWSSRFFLENFNIYIRR